VKGKKSHFKKEFYKVIVTFHTSRQVCWWSLCLIHKGVGSWT